MGALRMDDDLAVFEIRNHRIQNQTNTTRGAGVLANSAGTIPHDRWLLWATLVATLALSRGNLEP